MKKIKVYWAPFLEPSETNKNLIYNDPISLFNKISKFRNKKTDQNSSMFACPVVNEQYSNIFCFSNPLKSHYKLKMGNDSGAIVMPLDQNSMRTNSVVKASLNNNIMFEYEPKWIFFAEESVDMVTSAPYFTNAPHTQYGVMTPGKLDISKWFRVINIQFNLWPGVDEFIINKDEPLFYANFITNKKVELIRFEMNEYLVKHARTIASSGEWEPRIPLSDRFNRFKASRTNELVLKEIKRQVI